MITDEQLKRILDKAIEKALEVERKYLEETIVAEFNSSNSFSKKITIVSDFAETVGYDYKEDLKDS